MLNRTHLLSRQVILRTDIEKIGIRNHRFLPKERIATS
jgi:hypothetical protein